MIMNPCKHWIRASVAGTLLGGALAVAAALAQTPPAAAPRDTSGDQAAKGQRECQQMTAEDRQNCERRLQTEGNRPTPADEPRSHDQPPAEDRTPDPASSTDQAHSSTGRDETRSDAADNRTRVSQKDADAEDPPADEEDESTTSASDSNATPPPDTQSESDTRSDTADPPQQR
jgi:hypothetical protein